MSVDQAKRAIIFDMDGVLFLSSPAHERAYRQVLSSEGIDRFDYAAVAGMRTDEALAQVFREHGQDIPSERLQKLAEKKRSLAHRLLGNSPPVAERCKEVLWGLAQRYTLALATSGSKKSLGLFLRASGTKDIFSEILSGDEIRTAKPTPEIYLETFRRLDIPPKKGWVVEDSLSGVMAGLTSGACVIGVVGTNSAEELTHAGAVQTIGAISDLSKIL